MSEKNPYAGEIKNTGGQVVKGLCAAAGKKGKSTVKAGEDLRAGKK